MSFLKDIFHQKTAKEQQEEIKLLNLQTQKANKDAKLRETRIQARERLAKAQARLKQDKGREFKSSAVGKAISGVEDFIMVRPSKTSTKQKSVKIHKGKGNKPKKDFIQDFLGIWGNKNEKKC